MFNYKPLLRLLRENEVSKTELKAIIKISSATLAKISKNQYISMKVLNDICQYFDCKIEDVIEFTREG